MSTGGYGFRVYIQGCSGSSDESLRLSRLRRVTAQIAGLGPAATLGSGW